MGSQAGQGQPRFAASQKSDGFGCRAEFRFHVLRHGIRERWCNRHEFHAKLAGIWIMRNQAWKKTLRRLVRGGSHALPTAADHITDP